MATKTKRDSYAVIAVGGKQYVVREGEQLLVDRLSTGEGKTFHPDLLFVGGDGAAQLKPGATVTARVVGHVLGEKVRIGKYRRRTGYRRHNGYRSRLTQIEIEAIGARRTKQASTEPAKQQTVTKSADVHPPRGYADFTVAEIAEKAKRWKLETIEAALAYERAHANRKGAIAALESALGAKKEKQ